MKYLLAQFLAQLRDRKLLLFLFRYQKDLTFVYRPTFQSRQATGVVIQRLGSNDEVLNVAVVPEEDKEGRESAELSSVTTAWDFEEAASETRTWQTTSGIIKRMLDMSWLLPNFNHWCSFLITSGPSVSFLQLILDNRLSSSNVFMRSTLFLLKCRRLSWMERLQDKQNDVWVRLMEGEALPEKQFFDFSPSVSVWYFRVSQEIDNNWRDISGILGLPLGFVELDEFSGWFEISSRPCTSAISSCEKKGARKRESVDLVLTLLPLVAFEDVVDLSKVALFTPCFVLSVDEEVFAELVDDSSRVVTKGRMSSRAGWMVTAQSVKVSRAIFSTRASKPSCYISVNQAFDVEKGSHSCHCKKRQYSFQHSQNPYWRM